MNIVTILLISFCFPFRFVHVLRWEGGYVVLALCVSNVSYATYTRALCVSNVCYARANERVKNAFRINKVLDSTNGDPELNT